MGLHLLNFLKDILIILQNKKKIKERLKGQKENSPDSPVLCPSEPI